ncbi:hypothetical protein N7447_009218 [Penicillium robsamsonii]|uniref:uncharacterized protein n=1 Tax=Penicillium robsamsonii TaxID=1792511 RepID=UPI002548CD81|nr:uncharacterized protein N7447_009218 [Penicillium robsamsonii]KAJ5816985.1 hypothetical protein N7447_009218 [Penicillium robsamsonii]
MQLRGLVLHSSTERYKSRLVLNKAGSLKRGGFGFIYLGTIFGQGGYQIWVVWTHRYYESLSDTAYINTLYILRLVIENEALWESDLQVEALRAVILTA